jgi:hypothetical protein
MCPPHRLGRRSCVYPPPPALSHSDLGWGSARFRFVGRPGMSVHRFDGIMEVDRVVPGQLSGSCLLFISR